MRGWVLCSGNLSPGIIYRAKFRCAIEDSPFVQMNAAPEKTMYNYIQDKSAHWTKTIAHDALCTIYKMDCSYS